MNFKASAVDRQGDDVVVVTTTPDPHNQTTSAQTEVTGRVFLFSFCVCGFLPVCFLYKMCKSVPWLLSGPLTHVESQDGASEDAVVSTPTPNPPNQTTSAGATGKGIATFLIFRPFKWLPAQLLKSRLNLPKLELLVREL